MSLRVIWQILVVLCVILSCSEKEFTKDPAESFKIAREPYDDGDYEIAVTRLGEFKARFPYSQYAVEAELLLANAQFELEQFEEAAVSYPQFVKLHPKHPKLDFAMYRVGECYWQLAPEEIDREQDFTHRAIEEWEKLTDRLPNSRFSKKARKLVAEGKRRIAESYEFVSDFYCKLDLHHACAYRFIKLARKYPQFKDLRKKALSEAAMALKIVSKQKKEDPDSDKNLYFNSLSAEQISKLSVQLEQEAQKVKLKDD